MIRFENLLPYWGKTRLRSPYLAGWVSDLSARLSILAITIIDMDLRVWERCTDHYHY